MRLNPRHILTGVLVLVLIVLALGIHPAEAARKKRQVRKPPDRFASVVIEASTGYVISAQNPDKKLYPASLTKLMTLYLTFEALSEGRIRKNQYISISRRAAAQEPSSLGLQPGDHIRTEDAIMGVATKSANDAAVVLAEAVGGSEDLFARAMTAKARQLGMENTRFVNASGLFNKNQVSTARDMALLSQALIRDYPVYYRYLSTSAFTYKDTTYMNHNKLMATYQGMDGLKTGYVYASGYNLAASAVRNGTRLIGVIFGGQTAKSRNAAMAKLLNQSFERIGDIRVAATTGKGQNNAALARRSDTVPGLAEVSVDNPAETGEDENVIDQGDTDEDRKPVRIIRGKPPVEFAPQPLNTALLAGKTPVKVASNASPGSWAIQIGAFASREASLRALAVAKVSLEGKLSNADALVAPLMTSRGMIYRARLMGVGRNDATQACRVLKGSCLVLTAD